MGHGLQPIADGDIPQGAEVIVGGDMLVNTGVNALAALLANQTNWYIALGQTRTSNPDPRSLTALEDEFERTAVTARSVYQDTKARLAATFSATTGCGTIREVGLFDADAKQQMLNSCDVTTNWTSGNGVVVLNTIDPKEGSACIETVGTDSIPLANYSLGVSYSGFTTNDRLQLWYYISDPTLLTLMRLHIGSSGSDYYQFTISGQLATGWNWFSLPISSAQVIGNPDINAISRFWVFSTKTNSVTERLDKIRLFQRSGTMWFRSELTTDKNKAYNTVITVYWYVEFKQ